MLQDTLYCCEVN